MKNTASPAATFVAEPAAAAAQMVVKVKEPIVAEYRYLRPELLLFTYLHLAVDRRLTHALVENKVTAIAYETVQTADGKLLLSR